MSDSQLMARVKRIQADRRSAYERQVSATRSAFARRADATPAQLAHAVAADRMSPDRFPPAFMARLRAPGGAGPVLVRLLRGLVPDGLDAMPTRAQRRRLVLRCAIAIRDTEPDPARERWVATFTSLAQEDGRVDSFELMLLAAARRYLRRPRAAGTVPAARLGFKVAKVIATVAGFGSDPERGYRAAEPKLSLVPTPLPAMPTPYGDAMEFLDALSELESLPPLAKRELLFGLSATVAQDGTVTEDEADYVAAVADAIGATGWC